MSKELVKQLRDIVQDIENKAPLLLIGAGALSFKRLYRGPLRSVRTTDEVRELVSYYTGINQLDHPLVVEDLSFIDKRSSFLLLKLVEEAKFPIILLSVFDNVSPIILSRVKTVVKGLEEPVTSEFLEPAKGYQAMREYLSPDSHKMDKLKWISKHSPLVYYMEQKLSGVRNKEKIIRILG